MTRVEALREWKKTSFCNYLDDKGYPHLNPEYIKRELVDGKLVTSMPNPVPIVVKEK